MRLSSFMSDPKEQSRDEKVSAFLLSEIDKAGATVPEQRCYIGGSNIGHECDAYIVLSLRGFPSDEISGKSNRIFRDGHRIEEQTVSDLKQAGFIVEEVDPKTGKQFGVIRFGGHFRAHLDGFATLTVEGETEKFVLEIKSMNKQRFSALKSKKLKESDPQYYIQLQIGMGGNGLRGLIIAFCKDNADYEAQVLNIDPETIKETIAKVERLITAADGMRLSTKPDHFKCRMCSRNDHCWGAKRIDTPMCQHCKHSRPLIKEGHEFKDERLWTCGKNALRDEMPMNSPPCDMFEQYEPAKFVSLSTKGFAP